MNEFAVNRGRFMYDGIGDIDWNLEEVVDGRNDSILRDSAVRQLALINSFNFFSV